MAQTPTNNPNMPSTTTSTPTRGGSEIGSLVGERGEPRSATSTETAAGPQVDPDSEANGVQPRVSETPSQATMRRLLLTLVIFASLFVLYFGKPVLMPVVAGVLVSLLFRPIVRWLEEIHIPPVISAVAIVLCILAAMAGGITLVSMSAATWLKDSRASIQEVGEKIRPLRQSIRKASEGVNDIAQGQGTAPEAGENVEPQDTPPKVGTTADGSGQGGGQNPGLSQAKPAGQQRAASPQQSDQSSGLSATSGIGAAVLGQTATVLTSFLIIGALSFFLLASGDRSLRKLVEMQPHLAEKKSIVHGARQLQHDVSMFLLISTAINTCIALVLWGQFSLAGLDNALFWGVVGGVVNFVPYLGPIVSFALVLVASLLQFDSIVYALLPPVMVLWTNLIEGYGITPTIFGKRFALDPAIVFLSLVFWSFLWGLPGALMAVPLLVSFKIICEHIPAMHPMAQLLTGARPKLIPKRAVDT